MVVSRFFKLPSGKLDPERRRAIRSADLARDQGKPALAAELYQAVLDRWGPHFGIQVQLGNALKDSGDWARAETSYDKALELRPLDADCHLQLGHLMKLAGRPDRALDLYHKAHRLDPTLPGVSKELLATVAPEDPAAPPPDPTAAALDLAEAPPEPAVAPAMQPIMVVQTLDRGRRSVVLRERLVQSYAWRRN